MSEAPQKVECKNLKEAIEYVSKLEKEANTAIAAYQEAVRQLTGVAPGMQLTPMAVVSIFNKLSCPND